MQAYLLTIVMFSVHTNHMCFHLVYLNFSSATYEVYENNVSLCITVTHDRPAARDTTVEILENSKSATSKFLVILMHDCYYMVQINYKLNVSLILTWYSTHEYNTLFRNVSSIFLMAEKHNHSLQL